MVRSSKLKLRKLKNNASFAVFPHLFLKSIPMKKIPIITLVFLLLAFACKKENPQDTLVKTKWILSYIQDTRTNDTIHYPTDAGRKMSITFTDSLSIMYFTGVCNGGQGRYSYSSISKSISISDLATTQIGCKYQEWEGYVGGNLMDAYRYEVSGNTLVIYSRGKYELYFERGQR